MGSLLASVWLLALGVVALGVQTPLPLATPVRGFQLSLAGGSPTGFTQFNLSAGACANQCVPLWRAARGAH